MLNRIFRIGVLPLLLAATIGAGCASSTKTITARSDDPSTTTSTTTSVPSQCDHQDELTQITGDLNNIGATGDLTEAKATVAAEDTKLSDIATAVPEAIQTSAQNVSTAYHTFETHFAAIDANSGDLKGAVADVMNEFKSLLTGTDWNDLQSYLSEHC